VTFQHISAERVPDVDQLKVRPEGAAGRLWETVFKVGGVG
jgi:hypothetical protein